MGGTKTARHPRRDTKTLFPIHPLKSVLVSRPLARLFSILHARASFPRAPFRIANRPALNQAAHPRHPIPLTKNLRITQYSGRPTAKAPTRHISQESEMGAGIGAKPFVMVRPVCACQGRAPVSRCLHLIPCPKLFMADRRRPRRPAAGRL